MHAIITPRLSRPVLFLCLLIVWLWPSTASAVALPAAVTSCEPVYVVRSGDTLAGIASRCGVSVLSLMTANRLAWLSPVRAGQRLVLLSSAPRPASYACTNPYVVRPRDTMSAIAARCGTTVQNLMQWNRLRSSSVHTGQVLLTRGAVARSTPAPRQRARPLPAPTPRIEPVIPP